MINSTLPIMNVTPSFQTRSYDVYFDSGSGQLGFTRRGEDQLHFFGMIESAEDQRLFRRDPQDPLSYLQTIR